VREYDLHVPLLDPSGKPIPPEKLARLKKRVLDHFGGFTFFPQENDGAWRMGSVIFRDRIVILRVLSDEPLKSQLFFAQVKKELKKEWGQKDVLIVVREVKVV
jgi:hypothetical protein